MTKVENGDDQSPFRVGTKSYKVQVGLSKAAVDRLFELREQMELDGGAHVAREALRVLDILWEEIHEKGGELFLKQGTDGQTVRLRLF